MKGFVSIHPMCRFKKNKKSKSSSAKKVSIHPMCRFKDEEPISLHIGAMFQYILCVGSRVAKQAEAKE